MINIFYGPVSEFKKFIPTEINYKTLTELITELDAKNRKFTIVADQDKKNKNKKNNISNLVVTTEEYSRLSDSGLYGFTSFLSEVNITNNMYFQNPPDVIVQQLRDIDENIVIKEYEYKKISEKIVKNFYANFGEKILGQENSKIKFAASLYKISQNYNKDKPLVVLFYGPTGVGKTETAKYIANLMGEELFRKQFSMYQNNSFADYVFGSSHTVSSLAKDLIDRKSNVILFDEFDKVNSMFYSAFYQMFDEGIFVDKNYTLKLKNSIIICTSNFTNLSDVRKTLGDPIYSRFDTCIEYKELS